MITPNYTFWLQLINFIILLILLSKFFFKPLRAFLEEREKRKQDWLNGAKQDANEAESFKKQYRELLADGRHQALEIKTKMVNEAQADTAQVLEKARNERNKRIAEGRAVIEKEKEAAQASLLKEVDRLADGIVARVTAS